MLKDNFVDIYRVEEGSIVSDIVKRYHEGSIEPINGPHPAEESEIMHTKGVPYNQIQDEEK